MAKAKKSPAGRKVAPKLNPDDWLNGADADDGEGAASGTAGILVSKSRLGVILGIAQTTLDKMLAQGAPYVSKGSRKEGYKINTAAFNAWLIQKRVDEVQPADPTKVTFEDAKTRKMLADAVMRERENELKERSLVTIDEVVAVVREEAAIVRSQLMAIPGRVAIMVAAETDAAACERLVMDEINIALSNITNDTAEAWTDGPGTDSTDNAEH